MPDDLLDESRKRLSVVAFLGSVLWFTATALFHLARRAIAPDDPVWMRLGAPDLVAAINVVASAALCAWTRRSSKPREALLRASLAYMVFTSLSIAIVWHSDPAFHSERVTPMISWSGVVVMMFAAIIPIAPRTMVITGLLCVAMNPVAMLVLQRMGVAVWGSPGKVVLMHYPDFLLVFISGVISTVMMRMGHHVSKAREMGSYHLGELIGRGGMGEVYVATHRMLARKAAIKLIRRSNIGGDAETTQLAIARFRREAEVAASLRSPHTVALYDFGTTPEGALYIVMEYLEGMDLETLIRKEGAQPWQRVVSIMRQACDSLAEAHARGLVHRDIKPANLHIGRLGLQDDFVKVLDFGLVKSIGTREQPAAQTLATREGQTPGTPEFMPPEMALGEEVDGRADIYALGCVAFYLLTGRPVFEGTSAYHLIARHLNDPPQAPSTATPASIPAELDTIILACLRKRPADRPATAIELAESLARIAA